MVVMSALITRSHSKMEEADNAPKRLPPQLIRGAFR